MQDSVSAQGVAARVLADVKAKGADAVLDYSRRFDGVALGKSMLRVKRSEIERAYSALSAAQLAALRYAKKRVERFHAAQMRPAKSVRIDCAEMRWLPMRSVGIYAPRNLFSSVLMCALPARIAGVKRIALCTPPAAGGVSAAVLVAASECGVDEIYRIGGAQAIAALAYGLPGVMQPVDFITGPGNAYVDAAKRLVAAQGIAGIDLPAGPSELLVIADASADARLVAADMLAQAEHAGGKAICITTSNSVAKAVAELARAKNCSVRIARSIGEAIALANEYAAEHVEIFAKGAGRIAGDIVNAGAVFIGTGEAFGDYGMCGATHVLPTAATARFASGVSVFTFLRRAFIERMSAAQQRRLAKRTAMLARMEGLEAHAKSAEMRL